MKTIKTIFIFIILAMLPIGAEAAYTKALIERAVDGDTLICTIGGGSVGVRMIGVDTPERARNGRPDEPGAITAWEYVNQFVGATVFLESDADEKDKYGRRLAYVWLHPPREIRTKEVAENMLNAQLIHRGLGLAKRVRPNIKYSEFFKLLQKIARTEKLGLWIGN